MPTRDGHDDEIRWSKLADLWIAQLPDSARDRHQAMRDIIEVFPMDHPRYQTLRDMLTHLDQADLLQREFPFNR